MRKVHDGNMWGAAPKSVAALAGRSLSMVIGDVDGTGKRPKQRVIARPFVHGTLAEWLGPDSEQTRSHKWTIYVRGLTRDDDLSTIVRKVVFNLHDSFACPVRVVDKPPFEITEYGWGEFTASVKVYFYDRGDRHVDFPHPVNLFHQSGQPSKKPLLTEIYDEFVFVEPNEQLAARLLQAPVPVGPPSDPAMNEYQYNLDQMIADEKNEIGRVAQAHLAVLNGIQDLKRKFDKVHYEGLRYRKLIAACKKKE
ncbi:Protein AF-9 like protein [Plasmodiophora brassicae]|uniref:YEATS domain-containing protein n=1 Tax=Plasmodiophora brassicae TaxID=37360 RepID=A0A0G4IVL0_PLABS|nr:hypothetical protein PBRA_001059 [Plasmodiophora brassicae]SPQ97168.1 unnamed protein product [Plasmodiophora brassicae]